MAVRGLLRKTLFPPSLNELFAISLIFALKKIHLSGNFKRKKHSFKPLLRSIAPAINLKKKSGKNTLQVFYVLSARVASPSGIYGTLRLPLMLLKATVTRKCYLRLFMSIRVELRASGSTTFTHAQKYDFAKSSF